MIRSIPFIQFVSNQRKNFFCEKYTIELQFKLTCLMIQCEWFFLFRGSQKKCMFKIDDELFFWKIKNFAARLIDRRGESRSTKYFFWYFFWYFFFEEYSKVIFFYVERRKKWNEVLLRISLERQYLIIWWYFSHFSLCWSYVLFVTFSLLFSNSYYFCCSLISWECFFPFYHWRLGNNNFLLLLFLW